MSRQKQGPVRRSMRYAVNGMLVVFILAGLAWLLPSVVGYDRYVITGGSMSGTFEKGSLAIERKVPVADLEVGDIITYLPPADAGVPNLVTHRILSIKTAEDGQRLFQTKGDANAAADPWKFSLQSTTQPVVEYTIPKLGYLFIALAEPKVRLLMIGLPAALIALIALVDLSRALFPRRAGEADPADVEPSPRRRHLRAVKAA